MKRARKFTILKHLLFRKLTATANLKKFFSNTIFRWYTFSEFYIVKFNFFSWRTNKMKESFWNIFNWPLYGWYWWYWYCWYVLKKTFVSVTNPVLCGQVHTGCYIYNSLVHVIYILYVIEACLKVMIAMFYFSHRKTLRKLFSREMGHIISSRVVQLPKVIKARLLG